MQAEIGEHRAAYAITPPPAMPLLERARRGSRALLGMRALIEEMTRQRAELRTTHVELLRTQQDFQGVIESMNIMYQLFRPDGVPLVWMNLSAWT